LPELTEVLEFLPEVPEIRVLQTCAQRRRVRFGLYGGVVRNLLLTFHDWSQKNQEPSLYDLIDPFSDIDVLVDDAEDWSSAWEAIADSLPFAGFFRWEAQLWNIASNSIFEMIPVDRFILWIDGRTGEKADLTFGGLGIDPFKAWEGHLKGEHPDPFPEEWLRRRNRRELILTLLKLVRYMHEYSPEDSLVFSNANRAYATKALDVLPGNVEAMARSIRKSFQLRMEIAVLDCLFTTRFWKESLSQISTIGRYFDYGFIRASRLLEITFDERRHLEGAPLVGAVVHRPGLNRGVRVEIHAPDEPLDLTTAGMPPSVIPWTAVLVEDPNAQSDCCRYRDFRFGTAVIAWRTPQNPAPMVPSGASQDNGVVAVISAAPRYGDPLYALRAISIPGLIHSGTSVVLRIDHGYVRSIAGRDLSFPVGLVRMNAGEPS
jgi:hypothetical protein